MGQYYRVAFKKVSDDITVINDRKVEGCDYVMAKLMEHSWLKNDLCMAIANVLSHGKCRLAWIGDYAEDEELSEICNNELTMEEVWGKKHNNVLKKVNFDYHHKFLVNHTKGVYISFDKYIKTFDDEWRICPFSFLTAIGNGRGGGDYSGINMELIGTWAWDELEITSKSPRGKGMKLIDITFNETYYFN